MLRSILHQVSPERLRVSERGRARIRVEGIVYGYLRVGRNRRWHWGHFDETFVVQVAKGSRSFAVRLVGLGGSAQSQVVCANSTDLATPRLLSNLPSLRTDIHVHTLRGLQTRRIRLPRIVRLKRSAQDSTPQ